MCVCCVLLGCVLCVVRLCVCCEWFGWCDGVLVLYCGVLMCDDVLCGVCDCV